MEVKETLNKSAEAIENAQSDIRGLMQSAYLYGYSKVYTERLLKGIIERALKSITIPRLKKDTVLSLTNYANRQRNIWKRSGITPELLFFLAKRVGKGEDSVRNGLSGKYPNETIKRDIEKISGVPVETVNKGVPLQQFYGEVWKEKIRPVLTRLATERALDPNDYTGRNSLRNLAEMEVRYQDHKDSIKELKASGEKLVLCSAHADCSERCAPYQGRIYSLDGTSGEIDGKKYVPLEEATNNPRDRYVTKAGRVYQNGLLGFNCRHKLSPYRGQSPEYVSEKERKREYEITKTQRALERKVRDLKAKAQMAKSLNKAEYRRYKALSENAYDEYVRYSKDNERAYYPMRVRI